MSIKHLLMVLRQGMQTSRLPPFPPSTFQHVNSLAKALDWQYWRAKLSLFLLHRSEIRNQTSINRADSLPDRRHTVHLQSRISPRRVITRGTNKCQLLPLLSWYQCNQTGRRATPLLPREHPGTPEWWLEAQLDTAGATPMGPGWAPLWQPLPSAQCSPDPVDELIVLFF